MLFFTKGYDQSLEGEPRTFYFEMLFSSNRDFVEWERYGRFIRLCGSESLAAGDLILHNQNTLRRSRNECNTGELNARSPGEMGDKSVFKTFK